MYHLILRTTFFRISMSNVKKWKHRRCSTMIKITQLVNRNVRVQVQAIDLRAHLLAPLLHCLSSATQPFAVSSHPNRKICQVKFLTKCYCSLGPSIVPLTQCTASSHSTAPPVLLFLPFAEKIWENQSIPSNSIWEQIPSKSFHETV